MTFRRHDLLDVAPKAWADAVAELALPEDAARLVTDWCRRGWPVIVRRRLAGDAADEIPVAVQLPNAVGRLRVAVSVPSSKVERRAALPLSQAVRSAPKGWNATLSSLLDLAGLASPFVYGGLMWQHVTGEPMLRESSDLDLLWDPPPHRRLALLDALAHLDGGGVRIDGEIVLEDGADVSWRELHAATVGRTMQVAVKTMDGVALRDAASILRESVPC